MGGDSFWRSRFWRGDFFCLRLGHGVEVLIGWCGAYGDVIDGKLGQGMKVSLKLAQGRKVSLKSGQTQSNVPEIGTNAVQCP